MNGGAFSRRYKEQLTVVRAAGFTIVEVLIVLAVTMAIFASAILLVNGRQHTTEFNQSIHAFQTELQQTVNQVGSGYLATNTGTTCNSSLVFGSGATDVQGANVACIFLGKILQFGSPSSNPEPYDIYPLAGLNSGLTGGTYDIANTTSKVISGPGDYTTQYLQYGLSLSTNASKGGIYYGAHKTVGAIGFVSNLVPLATGDGSQSVSVVAIPSTSPGSGADVINNNIKNAVVDPVGGVHMCLNSGGTTASVLVTIGAQNGSSNIDLQIFSAKDCT